MFNKPKENKKSEFSVVFQNNGASKGQKRFKNRNINNKKIQALWNQSSQSQQY